MISLVKALPAIATAAKALGPRLHMRFFVTSNARHGAESETSQLQGSAVAGDAALIAELTAAMAATPSLDRQRADFPQLFDELRENMATAAREAGGDRPRWCCSASPRLWTGTDGGAFDKWHRQRAKSCSLIYQL